MSTDGDQPRSTRERELKFDVPTGFAVPDVSAVIVGVEIEQRTVRLVTAYRDTPALDLLSHRVTLRRRSGDTDTGWQLKVPAGKARDEITSPLGDGAPDDDPVPPLLAELLSGLVRTGDLVATATLRTERHLTRVTRAGKLVVEIADDHVVADTGARPAPAWREVEIELGPAGDEDDLAAFARALRRAGATPSHSRSKLARALGHPIGSTRTRRSTGASRSRAETLVANYLQKYHRALVAGDIALRRDRVEAVHATRVATRRIRSVLTVFADVLAAPPESVQALNAELSWYQDLLGEVRDRQVQRQRFADAVAALPDDLVLGPVAARFESVLLAEQLEAMRAVTAALGSNRYRRLLTAVSSVTSGEVVRADVSRRTLYAVADKAVRRASKRLRRAQRHDDPEQLHRARRAVKRARYAAEVVGRSTQTISRYKQLQDVLGEHQDATVAAEIVRRIGAATASVPDENGFTFGLLYQQEIERAVRLRAEANRLRLPS